MSRPRRAVDTVVAWVGALALAAYALIRPRAFRHEIERDKPTVAREDQRDEHRGRGER